MIDFIKSLFSKWIWSMAYRDSRADKWKLMLFSTSIVFGVAALVVIGSLRSNLNHSVRSQSKSLLGADILLSAKTEFSQEAKELTENIGGEQAREISFNTMLLVGDNPQPRLVSLRGIESGFPFYGSINTTPPHIWQTIQDTPGVLVEDSFLLSMEGKIGDMVTIGEQQLPILGTLNEAPPSSSGFAGINPSVITSFDILKTSTLLGKKSLTFYRTYFKLPDVENHRELLKPHENLIDSERLRSVTASERSDRIEKTINNLYLFLNLIGFSSLFLGGIGIAGAIHIHISQRITSVATLRCLGCTSAKAFAIYFIQGLCMGVVGTLLGVTLGSGLVIAGAIVLESSPDLIPFKINIQPVFTEIVKSAGIGLIISICFALLPLLKIRKISPLAALRQSSVDKKNSLKDPLHWFIILTLLTSVFLLSWLDNRKLDSGLITATAYVVFLVFTFTALLGVGFFLRWILKLVVGSRWPFTMRQGFSALYRPNNQTSIFMLSIGLGVFFIFTLVFMQNILLQWLNPERQNNMPNIFMVDLPPEGIEQAKQTIIESGAQPLSEAPIIQLRMLKVNETPVEEILAAQNANKDDEQQKIPKWILKKSFRCTTRAELSETEEITEGKWIGYHKIDDPVIPISIEEQIAKDLGVAIGDTISMEIEGFGQELTLEITSLRKINWQSMDINFFIVLPKGSVDDYVAFNVVTAHSPSSKVTAKLQQKVFEKWPSVSIVDLSLILKTVQSVIETAGKAITAMALFTVMTGSIVLISALLSGRKIRVREIVLLRTLGASKNQINRILAIEYILLGTLATAAGAGLASLACVMLSEFIFKNDSYSFPWQTLLIGTTSVIIATVLLGMLLSRGIVKTPPMLSIRDSQ